MRRIVLLVISLDQFLGFEFMHLSSFDKRSSVIQTIFMSSFLFLKIVTPVLQIMVHNVLQ